MKLIIKFLFALISLFSPEFCFSQELNSTEKIQLIEDQLEINLPEHYKSFLADNSFDGFSFFYQIQDWNFWDFQSVIEKTARLRKESIIELGDIVVADNEDDQKLLLRMASTTNSNTSLVHYLDGHEIDFFCYSFDDFRYTDQTTNLIDSIDSHGFNNQDLRQIDSCIGCKFLYAFYLNTSEYDENFSEERNSEARKIFRKSADAGHPDAAKELADYYYFSDNTDVDSVIYWRRKAIEGGIIGEKLELADFILDNRLSEYELAVELLLQLIGYEYLQERALNKLSDIYMKGLGAKKNYEKGVYYTQLGADLENELALANLSFFYYEGMGVKIDYKKAYELLSRAHEIAMEERGSSEYSKFLKKISKKLDK